MHSLWSPGMTVQMKVSGDGSAPTGYDLLET